MINLTHITLENAKLIREWANDEHYEEFFRRHSPPFAWGPDENIVQVFATSYFIRNEDKIVGLLTLANFDQQNKKAELGLLLDKNYKVKRIRSFIDACIQACDYLFNYLGYNKVYTVLMTHRKGLAMVMKNAGFTKDGTLPDNVFWKGEFHDEDTYSLLAKNFREIYQ